MNIFLGLIGVNEVCHLTFPCANIFFVLPPPLDKFSNGTSLSRRKKQDDMFLVHVQENVILDFK